MNSICKCIKYLILVALFGSQLALFASPPSHKKYIVRFDKPIELMERELRNVTFLSDKTISVTAFYRTSPKSSSLLSVSSAGEALRRYAIIRLPQEATPQEAEEFLRGIDGIEEFYPAEQITLSPTFQSLDNTSSPSVNTELQWALATIQARRAWQRATGEGIIIGVVDTGIDYHHDDLRGALWINSAEDANGNGTFEPWSSDIVINGVSGDFDGIDNDGNGFIDDVIGFDFVDQSVPNFGDWQGRDPDPNDEQGHGTSVSGVLSGQGNAERGVVGIAPQAKLMTLRAFDITGNAEDDDVAAAILYAALNGADVLNFSFGDTYFSPLMRDAIAFAEEQGCVMFASSGNAGGLRPRYPSNYEGIISVGATTVRDELAFFSTGGSRLALVAPGEDIYTTAFGNGYRRINGTSFAAPYAAGVAALLLELDKNLTPRQIRGILQSSADNINPASGGSWSPRYGAGRLNAARAVNTPAPTEFRIHHPRPDTAFSRAISDSVPVVATALAPLFSFLTVEVGVGEVPGAWAVIGDTLRRRPLNDTIAFFQPSFVQNGTYTLRLRLHLDNGTIMEERVLMQVHDDTIFLDSLHIKTMWEQDRRVVVVEPTFSIKARASLTAADDADGSSIVAGPRRSRRHFFSLPLPLQQSEFTLSARRGDLRFDTTITLPSSGSGDEVFPRIGIRKTSRSIAGGAFLINQTALLRGGEPPIFPVNTMDGTVFGTLKMYQFSPAENAFVIRDSTQDIWIPRAIGDADGDGIPDIFAQRAGTSTLLSRSADGNSVGRQLFTSAPGTSFWAAGMADLTGNGRDELIARNDTAFFAATLEGGNARILSYATNPTPPAEGDSRNRFGSPYLAIGDFDNDGNTEIAFGDQDGDFVISEFSDGQFTTEATFINEGLNASQFIASADIDGDGTPEILVGWHSDLDNNSDGERLTPIFTAQILKATGKNTYSVFWQEEFLGMRRPNPFKSALAAANLDGKPGDEIVIGIFPRCYIFTFEAEGNTMKPLWYHPDVVMNNIVAGDLEGTGTLQFGMETSRGVEFFTFDADFDGLREPVVVKAFGTDSTTAYIQWSQVNADGYTIFGRSANDDDEVELTSTEEPETTLEGLSPNTKYIVRVEAHFGATRRSSDTVHIFAQSPARPIAVEQRSNSQLLLRFSGAIADALPHLGAVRSAFNGIPATIAHSRRDELLLTFSRPLALSSDDDTLHIGSIMGERRVPTVPATLTYTPLVHEDTRQEMYILSAQYRGARQVELLFSELVSLSNVSADNFTFQPFGTIDNVSGSANDSLLLLTLSPETPIGALGRDYTITATNMTSLTGVPLTKGAGASISFRIAADDVKSLFAYPNPARLSEHETIMLAGIPRNSTVTIRSVSGEILRTLTETNGTGGIEWDFVNSNGRRVPPGVYLFEVELENSFRSLSKFVVLP